MAALLVLMMLTAGVAGNQDLFGSVFTFPQVTNTAHVRLNNISSSELSAITVCHRTFTDLRRDHALFSLATPRIFNDFMIFWDESLRAVVPHVRDRRVEYRGIDYTPNAWHSICTTWDSETGLVQMWFDGKPHVRKFTPGTSIRGPIRIVLGQDQDTLGGGFDINQSFIGMITDVHVWDRVLSDCEILNYGSEFPFTPGNVVNWEALDFQIVGRVLVQRRFSDCP